MKLVPQKVTLYHRASGGRVKVWSVQVNPHDCTVVREWGLLDGATQRTSDTMTSRGVPGTGAYKTPQQVAVEQGVRLVTEKLEEGYVADINAVRDEVVAGKEFDFCSLPTEFAPAKPTDDYKTEDPEDFLRIARAWDQRGLLMKQRKRDGERHYTLWTPTGDVRIYSRKMEDRTEGLPLMVAALKRLKMPPRTILDGELIVDNNGKDNFRAVGTVTRSGVAKSRAREAQVPLRYMLFDALFEAGRPVWKNPYGERWDDLVRIADRGDERIILPEVIGVSLDKAIEMVMRKKWEGLVLWRIDESSMLQMNGHPKLCNAYKWKPVFEGDFVATGFYYGTGKNQTVAGGINLAEYVDGVLTEIGNCGGFKGDSIIRKQVLSWKFPCVVQVQYDLQQPDTGALRFPVCIRRRPDKQPKECIRR